MKDYASKLSENEAASNRWLTRLKRATNKLERLRTQRVNLLRSQAKALVVEANAAEAAPAVPAPEKPKPMRRGKPERRINL